MHGTGHWIGLDVHDVGAYRLADGTTHRPLEPGMVVTVEPGSVRRSATPTCDERWRGIGVRIEDDVLCGPAGPDVLSDGIPKEIDEIEAIVGTDALAPVALVQGPPTPPAVVSPAPPVAPSPAPPAGPWIAAPRPWSTKAWLAQHDVFVARARQGNVDVLFLGDSIVEFFATRGKDVWDREIAPLGSVVDFGISGDRTQFVLWRAQHGELDGTDRARRRADGRHEQPRAATPENVARGVARDRRHGAREAARRDRRAQRAAAARRARRPAAREARRRQRAHRALADGTHVRWVDAGAGFVGADGTIPPR